MCGRLPHPPTARSTAVLAVAVAAQVVAATGRMARVPAASLRHWQGCGRTRTVPCRWRRSNSTWCAPAPVANPRRPPVLFVVCGIGVCVCVRARARACGCGGQDHGTTKTAQHQPVTCGAALAGRHRGVCLQDTAARHGYRGLSRGSNTKRQWGSFLDFVNSPTRTRWPHEGAS